jgi:hypothetical protein
MRENRCHNRSKHSTRQPKVEATAEEVASKTERTRNIESVYLNELIRAGYLGRKRKGKKVFFRVKFSRKSLAGLLKALKK